MSPGLFYRPLDAQQNYYSPDGAVLVDTSGNLYFYLNTSNPANLSDTAQPGLDISWERHNGRARWLYIAIPPEFTPAADTPSKWRVVTSITIDYHFIRTGRFDQYHPLAPNWWYIAISAPNVTDPATGKSSNYLYPAGQDFHLEESGIPIPEFPAAGMLAAASAIAAVIALLRRQSSSAIGH
ncbi:MAG: hypothetical protein QXK96_02065 [Candidatus Bathyarchaeia archaeon]